MRKRFLILGIILLASLGLLLYFTVFSSNFSINRSRAAPSNYSERNSYLFLSPLRAKADGLEKVRVTFFLLNDQGLGVAGRKVKLSVNSLIKIDEIQAATDSSGRAVFDLSTSAVGEYEVGVSVDGDSLNIVGEPMAIFD